MAWGSDDQNPSLAPSQTSGVNYAAQLNSAAYYNPLSGGSSSTGAAPVATGGGQPSYADRLNAAAPAQPKQTTSQALVDSLVASREKRGQSGKPDQAMTPGTSRKLPISAAQGSAIQAEAARLGIAPGTLAAVIGYETIGSFDPEIVGGKKNRYKGLIQMGPNERKAYGWRDGMSFEEQLHGPVHNYLVDRGVRPGHGIAEVYSIINAGSLKRGQPRWKASDRPGWDIRRHSEEIGRTYQPRFAYLDEGSTAAYPGVEMAAAGGTDMLAGGNVPMPRMRPNTRSAAYGAGGARSMAYADEAAAPEAPFDAVLAGPPEPRPRPQRDNLTREIAPYVVRPGDNLTEISRRFGVSIPEIAAANGIRDPNLIRVGQQLVIPAAATRTVDIPQPRVRPRIASGPVGPTTRQGVLDMGPRQRPGGAPDAGRVPDPRTRPTRQMAQADDIDRMTQVDEAGNYVLPQNVGGARPEGPVQFQSRIAGRPERPGALPAARAAAVEGAEQFGPGNRPGRVAFDAYRPREQYGPGNEIGRGRFDNVTAIRELEREMEAGRLAQESRDFAEEEGRRRAEMEAMTPPFRGNALGTGTFGRPEFYPPEAFGGMPQTTSDLPIQDRFNGAFAPSPSGGVIMDLPAAAAGSDDVRGGRDNDRLSAVFGPPAYTAGNGVRIWIG